MVNKILSACRDGDGKKLPDGVELHHIKQIKMNSYTNTSRDSVTMDFYFKGIKEIPNAKYYSIQNLTREKFDYLYNAIYDELDTDTDGLFPFWEEEGEDIDESE